MRPRFQYYVFIVLIGFLFPGGVLTSDLMASNQEPRVYSSMTESDHSGNSEKLSILIKESISNNMELQALSLQFEAAKAEIPFAGSFNDPIVTLGLANIPVDTFELDQEPMTQKQVSVSQKVPWFGTLDLKEQRAILSALIIEARLQAQTLKLVRQLRQSWYDLVFTEKSLQVNQELQALLTKILRVTEKRYATGNGLQQDVLAAQVQLSELFDEQVNLLSNKQQLQDRIGELLNREMEFRESGQEEVLPEKMDLELASLNKMASLQNPLVLERNILVDRAEVDVELAQKAYMPDITFRAGYGQREDDPVTGNDRADFFSASVSLSVPLWQSSRQDPKLAAMEKRLVSTQRSLEGLRTSLPHKINSLVKEIHSAEQNYTLFKEALSVQAGHLAESSLAAYAVGEVEFGTMLSSRMKTLRYELKAEKYKYKALSKLAALDELIGRKVNQGENSSAQNNQPSENLGEK